jgi:hypothetical protein
LYAPRIASANCWSSGLRSAGAGQAKRCVTAVISACSAGEAPDASALAFCAAS